MEGSDEPQASSSSSSSGSSNNEPSTHDQSVDHDVETSEQINTSSSEMDDAEDMEIEGELSGSITEVEGEGESGNMEVHLDDPSEPVDEMQMEAGPSNPGKRVKVRPPHLCHAIGHESTRSDHLYLGVRATRFILVRPRDRSL